MSREEEEEGSISAIPSALLPDVNFLVAILFSFCAFGEWALIVPKIACRLYAIFGRRCGCFL